MTKYQFKQLKKLHKLIIHNHKSIVDDKEWYRLARKETKQVEKYRDNKFGKLCTECGF